MIQFRLAILALAAVSSMTFAAHAVSSAEFYTSKPYQYGRFEARIQFATGDGVVSSFFLWKNGSEVSGTYWNELDFEKLGGDCHLQTNAIYGNPAADHGQTPSLSSSLCDQFHTYAYEWTPDTIAWLVDGIEIRRETGDTATAFAENATSGMQIRFNIWPGDASFGGNFDASILPVFQYVNWVQYSSYAAGAFKLAWREDFTANSAPSGWVMGNWASPKNLSTHTPSNVGFIDGYAVLSLTADDAQGSTGAAPVDNTDATGGTSGIGGAGGTTTNGASGAATGGASIPTTSSLIVGGQGGGVGTISESPTDAGSCGCHIASTNNGHRNALAALLFAASTRALRRRRKSR
jgi:endo-1,3-1,4-beta-glycanase ExoK